MDDREPIPGRVQDADTHELVDAAKLIRTGRKAGDEVTTTAGVARIANFVARTGIKIDESLGKALGLDQVPPAED